MDIVVDILVEVDMVLVENQLVEYILEVGNSLEYNSDLDLDQDKSDLDQDKVGLDLDKDNSGLDLDKDSFGPDLDSDNSEVDIDYQDYMVED